VAWPAVGTYARVTAPIIIHNGQMMRKTVDAIVIVCMFIVVYINWTDFPKQPHAVSGPLIKLGVRE